MTAVLHELSRVETLAICDYLHGLATPIDVVVRIVDHTVHLYPLAEVTTLQEVTVLRSVLGRTDARVAWHKVGAS